MTPGRARHPLPAAYRGSDWRLPVQVLDESLDGVRLPADLTGAVATLSMVGYGLPEVSRSIVATADGPGVLVFSASFTDTFDWPARDYEVELTIAQGGAVASLMMATLPVIAGANALLLDGDPALCAPCGPGSQAGMTAVVRAETGRIHIVRVDRVVISGGGSAAATTFDDTLTMLGVGNVQDAIVALYALIGGGPAPSPGGALDFSNPINSALIGAL